MEAIVLVLILGLAIVFLWGMKYFSGSKRAAPRTKFTQRSRRDELYGRLLSQVLGDQAKARRLIKHEQDKNPGLTEEQCIEKASASIGMDIKRWD